MLMAAVVVVVVYWFNYLLCVGLTRLRRDLGSLGHVDWNKKPAIPLHSYVDGNSSYRFSISNNFSVEPSS